MQNTAQQLYLFMRNNDFRPIHFPLEETEKLYFTSDTHFGHRRIIDFCHRPFKDTDEMDLILINNWNTVVPENGIVFHLGDFAFASNERWKYILKQLNGRIFLALGNHDISRYPVASVLAAFEQIEYQYIIKVGERLIYLNHYPFLCYAGTYHSNQNTMAYQLFGHVHSGGDDATGLDIKRLVNLFPTQYDVGVDNNNYFPISYFDIDKIIQARLCKNNNQ